MKVIAFEVTINASDKGQVFVGIKEERKKIKKIFSKNDSFIVRKKRSVWRRKRIKFPCDGKLTTLSGEAVEIYQGETLIIYKYGDYEIETVQ